jgi:hypothetical protein
MEINGFETNIKLLFLEQLLAWLELVLVMYITEWAEINGNWLKLVYSVGYLTLCLLKSHQITSFYDQIDKQISKE